MELSAEQARLLLDLAKRSIVHALRGDALPSIETEDAALMQPAGCFVSLHARHTHALRGCVGQMGEAQPLLRCVQDAAVSSLADPRFRGQPVTLAEVGALEIEISVLSPMRSVADPLSFDLMNDGIHLSLAGRTGVFLPQVARETGWSKEQLLERLCTEKLNLPPEAWRHPEARLQVFSTLILGPEVF